MKTHWACSIVLIGILFLSSCPTGSKVESQVFYEDYNEFEDIDAKPISGERLDIEQNLLFSASKLLLIDTLLIVNRFQADPFYYHVFHSVSGSYQFSFGRYGGGPFEFPDFSRPMKIPGVNNRMALVIPNDEGALYEVEFTEDRKSDIKKVSNLGYEFTSAVLAVENGMFYGLSLRRNKRLLYADSSGNILNNTLEYPPLNINGFPESMLGMVYQGLMTANWSEHRLAIFNMYALSWDVISYDSLGNSQVVYRKQLTEPQVYDNSSKEGNVSTRAIGIWSDNVTGFQSVDSNSEFIYALYSGRTYKEFGDDYMSCEYVLKMNWDGEIIEKLKLEEDSEYLAVSEDNKLYVYSERLDDNLIRVYDLEAEVNR